MSEEGRDPIRLSRGALVWLTDDGSLLSSRVEGRLRAKGLNVLRGEMSIVGVRPPIPYEVEEYDFKDRRRLDMKPGITGLWQVSGRNRLTFEEMVRIDIFYIENWSVWLDLKIILLTLPAVLRGDGAR